MDQAKTVIDGVEKRYFYHEFAVLGEDEINRLRPYLYCHSCNAKANFFRESVSGSQAHFKLRPGEIHKDCDEIKYDNDSYKARVKQEDARLKQEVEKIKNDTNVIDIVSSSEAQFEGLEKALEKAEPKDTKKTRAKRLVSQKHTIDSDKIRSSEKSLIQLLKYCMRTTKLLADSEIAIRFKGRLYKVNERIYNFFEISNIPNPSRPYFFWGSVKYVKDLQFLNVGKGERVSVIIDDSIKDELWKKMRVDNHRQLLGCNIICFGWANRKGNLTYIQVKNIGDIGFIGVKSNGSFVEADGSEPLIKSASSTSTVPEKKPANDALSSSSQEFRSEYSRNLEQLSGQDKKTSVVSYARQEKSVVNEPTPNDNSRQLRAADEDSRLEKKRAIVPQQKKTLWKRLVRFFIKD